jgi:hypothetical protein
MFPHLKVEVSEFHSNNGRCGTVTCISMDARHGFMNTTATGSSAAAAEAAAAGFND